MKKFLFILFFPILLFGQVTFQKTKNQQVWYDATKEHGTVWTDFDSSCIKMGKTSTGNFYLQIYDKDGNLSFYADSSGTSGLSSLSSESVSTTNLKDSVKTFDIAFIAPSVCYSYGDSLLNVYMTETDTLNFALSVPFSAYGDSIGLDSLVLTTKGDASSYIDYIKIYSASYGQKTEKYSSTSNVNFTGNNQYISFNTGYMLVNNQPILLEIGVSVNSYVNIYDVIVKCRKNY